MAARRTLLRLGLLLPLIPRWSGTVEARSFEPLCGRVRAMFRHPVAADVVGASLRASASPGCRIATIAATLEGGRGDLFPIPKDADGSALRAAIGERIRADFRSGRTRWFQGWLLAETEVNLLLIVNLMTVR